MNQRIIDAKEAAVNDIAASLKASQSAVVVEYRGLTVAELTTLRRKLRKEGAEMKVFKNNLVERAASSLGYVGLDKSLTGPNALVIGNNSVSAAPKILVDFARKQKKLVIKAGVAEGKVLDAKQVKEIATLPSKEGMLAMLLGCLNAPIIKFACTVKAVAEKQQA